MPEMRESLEAIRDMARSRVKVLKEGGSCYSDKEKAGYLQQYETRLRELDRLIRELDHPPAGATDRVRSRPAPLLKKLFGFGK